MVCMNGIVVLSRGLIHYLAGNRAKKMTWQAGGPRLRVLCLRHAQMEDDPCGDRSHTSEVIASRVATTDFAASSTKGDRHHECRTDVPCVPARPLAGAAASGVTGALLVAGARPWGDVASNIRCSRKRTIRRATRSPRLRGRAERYLQVFWLATHG